MDNEDSKKKIEALATEFLHKWQEAQLPDMDAMDLLDLMDYFEQRGMNFEADLCRHIAESQHADNPEVKLTIAHELADMGNWNKAASLYKDAGITGYDALLFGIEHSLRLGMVARSLQLVDKALPSSHKVLDITDYDFIYDAAVLFRDYGYVYQALSLLDKLSPSYHDYFSALEMRAECLYMLHKYEDARVILNQLLDHSSFETPLWYKLASCCYAEGNYKETIEACEYAKAIGKDEAIDQLLELVRIKENGGQVDNELLRELKGLQDHWACMEYAEQLYSKEEYGAALELYGLANLYCPNGHKLQETILMRSIVCLVRLAAYDVAIVHLYALVMHKGDFWACAYEIAQLMFEDGAYSHALKTLEIAHEFGCINGGRYNQVADLLHHYSCYKEARGLWNNIISNQSLISKSYRALVSHAMQILGDNSDRVGG